MKSGKIKNGRIVNVVNGEIPKGNIEINITWSLPRDFPRCFYRTKSTEPILTIVGKEIHEKLEFELNSIEEIKSILLDKVEEVKNKKLKATFDVDGVSFTLNDINEAQRISSLSTKAKSFKIKKGVWIKSSAKISLLKRATSDHIEGLDDWELEQNDKIEAMTTMSELKEYYESL